MLCYGQPNGHRFVRPEPTPVSEMSNDGVRLTLGPVSHSTSDEVLVCHSCQVTDDHVNITSATEVMLQILVNHWSSVFRFFPT